MTKPPSAFHIERETGATRQEYLRQLRLALPGAISADDGLVIAADGRASLEITVTELPPHTIAALTLPRLKVSLRGTAGDDAELAAPLDRLDRAMQRGGG